MTATGVRHVVVPLDRSDATGRALGLGRWLAERAGADLVLTTGVYDPSFVEGRRREMQALVAGPYTPVPEAVVRFTHDAGELIVDVATTHADSVVCMASHGPGRITEFLLGTITQHVVRHAPGPVVLVGPQCQADPSSITTLVACLDGSPASEAVTPVVARWAKRLKLAVVLIEVIDAETVAALQAARLADDVTEDAMLQREAMRLRGDGLVPNWDTLHGDEAADAIVDYAERHPGSMLVLGTHGHGGVAQLVMGSVAMQVVHRSPVPVVVVRGHPREST